MSLPFGWTCYVQILTELSTLWTSQADVCKVCKPYLWTWCHQAFVFFFKQWPQKKKRPFPLIYCNWIYMWSATENSYKNDVSNSCINLQKIILSSPITILPTFLPGEFSVYETVFCWVQGGFYRFGLWEVEVLWVWVMGVTLVIPESQ